MLRKEYGVNPDALNDEEWCKLYAEYLHLNKLDHLKIKHAVIAGIAEILVKLNVGNNNTLDT